MINNYFDAIRQFPSLPPPSRSPGASKREFKKSRQWFMRDSWGFSDVPQFYSEWCWSSCFLIFDMEVFGLFRVEEGANASNAMETLIVYVRLWHLLKSLLREMILLFIAVFDLGVEYGKHGEEGRCPLTNGFTTALISFNFWGFHQLFLSKNPFTTVITCIGVFALCLVTAAWTQSLL